MTRGGARLVQTGAGDVHERRRRDSDARAHPVVIGFPKRRLARSRAPSSTARGGRNRLGTHARLSCCKRRQPAPSSDAALTRGAGWMTPDEAQRVVGAMGIGVLRHTTCRARRGRRGGVCPRSRLPGGAEGATVPPFCTRPMWAPSDSISATTRRCGWRSRSCRTSLGAQLAGVLVQRMAPGGVEMFVGGLQDATFGPVIFCGSGGVLVELFGDVACRLCPITRSRRRRNARRGQRRGASARLPRPAAGRRSQLS